MDRVIASMSAQLRYVWTFAVPFAQGGNYARYGRLNIFQLWRPVLVFHNGTPDNCRIATNIHDRFALGKPEKDWHPWQQNLADTHLLVQTFSLDGDLVVDPLGGGFTTGAAVIQAGRGRRFVGCDIVKESVDIGRYRLNILASELPLP
jgi:DNA modification methylase